MIGTLIFTAIMEIFTLLIFTILYNQMMLITSRGINISTPMKHMLALTLLAYCLLIFCLLASSIKLEIRMDKLRAILGEENAGKY